VPLVGLLALGRAESTWRRRAERWGDRTKVALSAIATNDWEVLRIVYDDIQQRLPNDISFGYGQVSIVLAARHGLGDGGWDGLLTARSALFDGKTNLRIMANHYRNTLDIALQREPSLTGDDLLLAGMCIYNGGDVPGRSAWYDDKYAANIMAYRAAIEWAHELVG